jgi:hypothetical protein
MEIPYCELNAGRFGYSTRAMNPPPAEKKRNVIQFSLTEGCSHSACTFCDMYGDKGYKVKSIKSFKEHVDAVINSLMPSELFGINRIFIGAGNALSVDTDKLMEATQYTLFQIKQATGGLSNRLAIYGNTKDIIKQGYLGLKKIRCGGTCGTRCSISTLGDRRGVEVVYWGMESGNSEVLQMAGKGYNSGDVMDAIEELKLSRIRSSIMIIPGLGGRKYFEEHIEDTAKVLNQSGAEWITFIGLKAGENTPYAKRMEEEEKKGTNRRLTPTEIVEQTARIIEGLNLKTTIGVHGNDVHKFGYNPIAIGATEISGHSDAKHLAFTLRAQGVMHGLSSKLEKIIFN